MASPLPSLPYDVLLHIFTLLVHDSRHPRWWTFPHPHPLTLSQVCEQWKQAAMTPSLWSQIRIMSASSSLVTLEKSLSYSMGLGLDIWIQFCSPNEDVLNQDRETEISEMLIAEAHRLVSLTFSIGNGVSRLPAPFQRPLSLPNLRRLIFCHPEHYSTTMDVTYPTLLRKAPVLGDVAILSTMVHPLRPFVGENAPRLTKAEFESHVFDARDFIGLLRSQPDLVELAVQATVQLDILSSSNIPLSITHSTLRHLSIWNTDPTLFRCLSLPSLHSLAVGWHDDPRTSLAPFIAQTETLRTLSLKRMSFGFLLSPEFSFPHISHLHVELSEDPLCIGQHDWCGISELDTMFMTEERTVLSGLKKISVEAILEDDSVCQRVLQLLERIWTATRVQTIAFPALEKLAYDILLDGISEPLETRLQTLGSANQHVSYCVCASLPFSPYWTLLAELNNELL
ncbi:hypothetical protein DL96DRAFT_1712421 [Flagelloscypha sp. PMI_526]|nr:hypothetical protein DL96DRAFT_1712421 [Flagelloscypha sp. PMI_526]